MAELITVLAARFRTSGERMMVTLVVYMLVMLLLLSAYAALIYAIAVALAAVYGPVVAALVVAGMSLVLALIAIGWLSYRSRRQRRIARHRRPLEPGPMTATVSTLIPMMVRASPLGSLLAIGAAAYVLSRTRRDI